LRGLGVDISTAYYQQQGQSGGSPAPAGSVSDPNSDIKGKGMMLAPAIASASTDSTVTPSPSIMRAVPVLQTYRVANITGRDRLNVRQGPGSNYPVVARIAPGVGGILLLPGRIANGATFWQEIS